MAEKTVTVNDSHTVHADPVHGLRLPDAAALAAKGVVTASAVTYRTGDTLRLPVEDVEQLERAGAGRTK